MAKLAKKKVTMCSYCPMLMCCYGEFVCNLEFTIKLKGTILYSEDCELVSIKFKDRIQEVRKGFVQ